jgi:hypothetical protein
VFGTSYHRPQARLPNLTSSPSVGSEYLAWIDSENHDHSSPVFPCSLPWTHREEVTFCVWHFGMLAQGERRNLCLRLDSSALSTPPFSLILLVSSLSPSFQAPGMSGRVEIRQSLFMLSSLSDSRRRFLPVRP